VQNKAESVAPEPWRELNEENLSPLQRILPNEVYQALQGEIRRQREDVPHASGLGLEHLNTIPANYPDALKKTKILMDRTLRWRRLCFVYELAEREARKIMHALAKRNTQLEARHKEDQEQLRRLRRRINSLLKIPDTADEEEPPTDTATNAPSDCRLTRKRGAPKGHAGKTRPIPDHVDAEEVIAPPEICPDCGCSKLNASDTFDERYIEDIPPILRIVTRRRYRQAHCPCCQQIVHHPDALRGPPVQTGPRLASHLAMLRARLGVTYRHLAVYSTEMLNIALTASGALGIVNRITDRLEPSYAGLADSLPRQPVLHGDETGWKMDGARWQMWCLCNARLAFFHADKSRGSKVVIDLLGQNFPGLLHCDFYGAYNSFSCLQRCLVHFVRDIREERLITPGNVFLDELKRQTQIIVDSAKVLHAGDLSQQRVSVLSDDMQQALNRMLALQPPSGAALRLVKRLHKHRDSLLNFINVPGAEYHNNRAERQIRPVVIFRKLSFGNRTEIGAHRHAVLISVVETLRLQHRDISSFLLRVRLAEPSQFVALAAELINSS